MEKYSATRCEEIAANVARGYLYPSNSSDFAYLSRLSQAENCKKEIFKRRRGFGDAGRAIISSVSSERLISESTLDLDAGWKAAHYYAAEFFSPIAIDAEIFDSQVTFFAYNNKPTAAFGKLEYRIIDSECNLIYKNTEDIEIEESSGKKIFTRDFTEYVGANPGDRVLEYIFTDAAGLSFRGSKLFSSHKSFEYKDPKIKAEVTGSDRRFSITLTAEAYAGAVELGLTDIPAVFSDNYFDITTKAPVRVEITLTELPETVKNIKKQLKIRCINEIGRK
jgi:beta-mannosidase